jgi:hypothetical protein
VLHFKFELAKLYTLAEIIRVSQENIERFRGKIRLTNNQLTESWNKNAESIRAKEYEVLEQLRNIAEPTEYISTFCSLAIQNNLLVDTAYLKNEASNRVSQITSEVRYQLLKQFKKEVRTKNDRVNNFDSLSKLEEFESFDLNFIDYQKDTLLKSLNFLPSDNLVGFSRGMIRESDNQLVESYKELQKTVNVLKSLITDQKPIKSYQLILSSSIKDLYSDFDTYFDSIAVYRSQGKRILNCIQSYR